MASLSLGRNRFGNEENKGNLLPREAAVDLLNEWVTNDRLRLHMRQVGGLLKAWALEKEHADEHTALKWEQAGLLHDADWEKYPEGHCRVIIEKLEALQVDPELIHAIAAHGPRHFGVQPETALDKMIYVFDELSGFIHAAALIRPMRYEGLEVSSVLKKLKTLSFAAQVNREEIMDAISRTDLPLEEVIAFIIAHQKLIS